MDLQSSDRKKKDEIRRDLGIPNKITIIMKL